MVADGAGSKRARFLTPNAHDHVADYAAVLEILVKGRGSGGEEAVLHIRGPYHPLHQGGRTR